MYKIDTGQARTDLFEVGKRAFQVADFSPDDHFAERQAEARQARKDREQAAIDAKIQAELGRVKNSINPRDLEYFAQRQGDLNYATQSDIANLRNGDPTSTAKFRTALTNLNNETQTSNAWYTKEYVPAQAKVLTKGRGKFYKETLDGLDNAQNPENAGKWEPIQQPQEIPDVPADKYAMQRGKDLMSTADTAGHPRTKKVSAQEADMEIEQLAHNPEYTYGFVRQVTPGIKGNNGELTEGQLNSMAINGGYDANGNPTHQLKLTHDEDKLKNTDVYAPATIENVAKAQLSRYVKGDYEKVPAQMNKYTAPIEKSFPKVSATYTKGKGNNGEIQFEYIDKTDNPYITITDPNSGQPVDVKPYKFNYGTKELIVETKAGGKDDLGQPIPAKQMKLDYNYASDILHNKFGIDNVYDLQNSENVPEHVTVKRFEIKPNSKSQTKSTELSGKIKPSSLVKGQSYTVSNKNYIWNGTKLIPQ